MKGIFKNMSINLTNMRWVTPSEKINSPIIHREFTIDSVDENATLLISGLGYFEVYINGKKVSDDLMNPVRTDYSDVVYKGLKYPFNAETRKSIMFVEYEVSEYLKAGKNKISVWLGNGWYIQKDRIVEGEFIYGDDLKTAFRLTNGNDVIESDDKCCYTKSPIIYDNIFYGEVYDFNADCTEEKAVDLILIGTEQIFKYSHLEKRFVKSVRLGIFATHVKVALIDAHIGK